jgi:hypothetical protein
VPRSARGGQNPILVRLLPLVRGCRIVRILCGQDCFDEGQVIRTLHCDCVLPESSVVQMSLRSLGRCHRRRMHQPLQHSLDIILRDGHIPGKSPCADSKSAFPSAITIVTTDYISLHSIPSDEQFALAVQKRSPASSKKITRPVLLLQQSYNNTIHPRKLSTLFRWDRPIVTSRKRVYNSANFPIKHSSRCPSPSLSHSQSILNEQRKGS